MRVEALTDTEAKAEKIAENVWLKLAGRVLMTAVGAIMLPATIGMWSWANATNESLSDLKTRVVVLENNSARGRADRVDFQEQTGEQLRQIQVTLSTILQEQASQRAILEGQQRQIDMRR